MYQVCSALKLNFRNKAKLQAKQREYARRKRAPGRRKVSKAERQLLEERYSKKKKLVVEMEGLLKTPPSAALSQCVLSSLALYFSHRHQGFTHAHSLCVRKPWILDAPQE
jgi:hypothetical protein